MSISYSGIVGYGKATLPSVETWGTNMNILRDPPKSITTRKIDRVGQTSEITQMIQESGDRVGEVINTYARGVNPMVAVSYDNYGNNGGQRRGNRASAGMVDGSTNSGRQAYLPYRIMQGGAFRPPIRDQRDLFPLSRLPRVWTSSYTQPGFADFSKKAICPTPEDNLRGVKTAAQMLPACARPTATYKIETPINEPFEVRYVIKNPVHVSAESGKNSTVRYNGERGQVTNQINAEPLRPDYHVQQGVAAVRKQAELDHFNTAKYTQDRYHAQVGTNASRPNAQLTPTDQIYGLQTDDYIQDGLHVEAEAHNRRGYTKNEYIHQPVELARTTPLHEIYTNKTDGSQNKNLPHTALSRDYDPNHDTISATTNIGRNIHKKMDHVTEREYLVNRPVTSMTVNAGANNLQAVDNISSRQYRLLPTVNPGGFDPRPNMPQVYHENGLVEFDAQKGRMRQRVYDMQQERNSTLADIRYQPVEGAV